MSTYNFTIHVPRTTALRLHTVNGKIEAADTAGKFDIHTINGAMKMSNVAGHGYRGDVERRDLHHFPKEPRWRQLLQILQWQGRRDVCSPAFPRSCS